MQLATARQPQLVTGPEALKAMDRARRLQDQRDQWPYPWLCPPETAQPKPSFGSILCPATGTLTEVLEYAGAFMQLYREEAHYLDRTAPWIARVGIDYVKSRLVDDSAGRRALNARFLYSQQFVQVDPWSERVRGAESHEFARLPALTDA